MIKTLDHRQHLRSLDGLRGLAIVMVFLFHYYPRNAHDPLQYLAGLGWLGVDLFFVLSGFLITGILYDTLPQRHFFLNFYARRALRLFPIYFVMVGIVLAIMLWLGQPYSWWYVPYFLYGSNLVGDLGHSANGNPSLVTAHLWSLALEEQFYLLWAPAVFFLRTRKRILIACLIGSLFSIILRSATLNHPPFYGYTPYMELPTRLDALLCGGALALVLRMEHSSRWLRERWLNVAIAAGAILILGCVIEGRTAYWSNPMMIRFGYAAASVMFGALVVLAIQPGTWVNRLGNISLLRTFGRYSYGFYLWHQIPEKPYQTFLSWVSRTIHLPVVGHVVGMTLLFAFNMGLAFLSYHSIELYFLRLKRYFAYDDEDARHQLVVDQEMKVALPGSHS